LPRRKIAEAPAALPSREEVVAFIAEHPDRATKRDIARAFDVSGVDRVALKDLLRGLEAEGLFEKRRKRLVVPGSLPPVSVLEIVARDEDGEFLAEPVNWEEAGDRPRVLILASANPRAGRTAEAGLGDRVLARIVDQPTPGEPQSRPTARIMKVIERAPESVLGIFRTTRGGAGRIEPISKKQREEFVIPPGDTLDAGDGDLVAVEVVPGRRSGLARARIREIVGSAMSEQAVSMIAIHDHELPHIFPQDALAEAAKAGPAPLEGREDWRALPLITIDPADAKDHDDAVHAAPDEDPENEGGWIVTVAIADVAWYVRPGTALDREALHRGNSVYFPDRVIPMLPERISNDLCSLRESVDRPALAVRMVFGADGVKRTHRFHRIMMRSAAKLAYEEAQAAVDGRPTDKTGPLLTPILRPLWGAYRALLRARGQREPLDLDLPERKILLKPDGTVDRIVVPERLDAHRLIEEFMIQANVAAAETLEAKRSPLVYRIHDAPSMAKLEALREFLGSLDIDLAKQGALRPSAFNRLLERMNETEHAHIINEVVLRSQSQAEYSPINIGHFGLNLQRYAHFTSPIRRYADLIVHRALIRALDLGAGGLPEGAEARLEKISSDISTAERRAMAAERDTVDRLIAGWLAERIGAMFHGRIGGVTKAGLFVRLDESGADGFVPIASLGAEYFSYDEAGHRLVGERSGTQFRLGDGVEVRLVEAAPTAGALRFEVVSGGSAGAPRRPRRGQRRPERRPTRPPRGSGARARSRG